MSRLKAVCERGDGAFYQACMYCLKSRPLAINRWSQYKHVVLDDSPNFEPHGRAGF